MILLVESAEYMGKYTLLCTFNNGERRKVDLTPLLKYPAFEELKDESEFERYGVDGTVFWANGADIAPEFLYEMGHHIKHNYLLIQTGIELLRLGSHSELFGKKK